MRTLLLSIVLLAGCAAAPLPSIKLAGPPPARYVQLPLEVLDDEEPWASEEFGDDEYSPEAPASQPSL
jgi:hypothetical protein